MERNSMYTLAAHGDELFGFGRAKAKSRHELRLNLNLNKDAWKALLGREQEDWVTHLRNHVLCDVMFWVVSDILPHGV